MTNNETKKLLMGMECSFPTFKVDEDVLDYTVQIWTDDLRPYSYEQVYKALKDYKKTSNSPYAPSASQLINMIHISVEMENSISEADMWNMVYTAIKRASVKAEKDFNKFPPIIQELVGSPNRLVEWGQTPTTIVEDRVRTGLILSYKNMLAEHRMNERMHPDVNKLIEQTTNKMIGANNEGQN